MLSEVENYQAIKTQKIKDSIENIKTDGEVILDILAESSVVKDTKRFWQWFWTDDPGVVYPHRSAGTHRRRRHSRACHSAPHRRQPSTAAYGRHDCIGHTIRRRTQCLIPRFM